MVWVVTLGKGVLLKIPWWIGQPPPERVTQPKTPVVPKLRLPTFKLGNSVTVWVCVPERYPLRVCDNPLAAIR